MSAKSRAGKEAWAARGTTYQQDFASQITDRITKDAQTCMEGWQASGRIPLRVRIMARLAGRRLALRDGETGR
jgi:hypothetical protein